LGSKLFLVLEETFPRYDKKTASSTMSDNAKKTKGDLSAGKEEHI
jgi:hypothetical protein